jgi:hypothetical protein
MRRSDIAAGLGLFLLGLYLLFWVIPDQIPGRGFGGLPPDFFPRWLAIIFIALTALLAAARLIEIVRARPSGQPEDFPIGTGEILFITGATIGLVVTYWLMANVGFIPAGIFAVGAAGLAMARDRRGLIQTAITMIAAPVTIYFAFRHLFLVFLPG